MINLVSSTQIERPIKQVFNFVSTPENDLHWQQGTLATATLPKGDLIQTIFRSIGGLMGRRNLSTFEVTDYDPDEKYGFKSLSGPLHSNTSYILEDVDGKTRLHIFIQARASNFFQIAEPLLENVMKKQLEEDVARLKTILEQDSAVDVP